MILYNPHVDDFLGAPPHFSVLRRRPLKKYGFLIKGMVEAKRPFRILLDAELSAFIPGSVFQRLPGLLRKAICQLEFKAWCRLNHLNPSAYQLVLPDELTSDDTVFAFSYKGACGDFKRRIKYLKRCHAVVFHLSHYFLATREKSENLKSLPNVFLAGDSNISKNLYFKEYFGWYQRPFLVLPFAVAPRFVARAPFADRDSRCIATGSFHDLTQEKPVRKYVDYLSFSGLSTYHPIRKEIFSAQERLVDVIASYISPYRSYSNSNFIRRMISRLNVSQKSYFAQDIVSLYNKYRYAVVGEEWSGFPALGALEAMACGALLIANPSAYEGMGLQPNVHFIPYDGTLPNLLAVLNSLDFETAFSLSNNGYQFVSENCTESSCYKQWLQVIQKISTGDLFIGAA